MCVYYLCIYCAENDLFDLKFIGKIKKTKIEYLFCYCMLTMQISSPITRWMNKTKDRKGVNRNGKKSQKC